MNNRFHNWKQKKSWLTWVCIANIVIDIQAQFVFNQVYFENILFLIFF
jgi:hypothetical protein